MAAKKLKGKGGLDACPNCKHGIQVDDIVYPSHEIIIQYIRCATCGKTYSEMYKAIDWEER